MEYMRRTMTGEVDLDGNTFVHCTFENAVLVYSGGKQPQFLGCDLRDCTIRFSGPAERTVRLLKAFGTTGLRRATAAAIDQIFSEPEDAGGGASGSGQGQG